MNSVDEFYSVSEIAEILQVSTQLVYALIRQGAISAHKVGDRQYRIAESDFKEYLASAKDENRACHNQPTAGMPGRHTPQRTQEAPI
jgi:excisionase family DNA binding protein